MIALDATHDPARRSWVETANDPASDFPIQNLPFGRFRPAGSAQPAYDLSTREMEILEALSQGLRYKEVADRLFISIDTVRSHIRTIYGKLQVQSRTDALNKVFPR